MSKPRVFVTRPIPESGLARVRAACAVDLWAEPLPPPREVILDRVAPVEGILSLLTDRIDAEVMDRAPRLKVVSNMAVGFNNIEVAEATRRGIAVGHTPNVLTEATADMAFCLLIAAARSLVESNRYILEGRWRTWEPLGHIGQDLVGKTLGVVGMGRIGQTLARRCHRGWDMRILYSDMRSVPAADETLGARRVDLDTLLAESDFVSVHTDLNEQTKGLFDAAAFRKMKRSAVFVNTARGPIVVQKDLVEALQKGVIFAAGLDVTDPEPIAPDDPLMKLPNAVVAPHIASATIATRTAMAEIAADNLLAGLRGEPLRCPVNPEVQVAGRQRVTRRPDV
jgi:glyoxylate reductase